MSSIDETLQNAVGTSATGDQLIEEVKEAYQAKDELKQLKSHLRRNYTLLWSLVEVDLKVLAERTKKDYRPGPFPYDQRPTTPQKTNPTDTFNNH